MDVSKIHPLDIPFESFQKRLRTGELRTPDLNDSNRRLYGLPSHVVTREAFAVDREWVGDTADGFRSGLSGALTVVTPTWAWHGRGKR